MSLIVSCGADHLAEGPVNNDEEENHWWQQLPLVPAVTGVLLRQQNRRRWKLAALAQMFARLPRLREIHYEPWMEWIDTQQPWAYQRECCSPLVRCVVADSGCS
jgi:hypothetical protein